MKNNFIKASFDKLPLTDASIREIHLLLKYHYRTSNYPPFVKGWKISEKHPQPVHEGDPIGIITYSMPVLNCTGRREATGGFFNGGDKQTRLLRLNHHVRRISRVAVDPRFRGIGLASRLVQETMPKMGVSMVETIAVMGRLSGFFERAGMRRFEVPPRPEAEAMARALKTAGIDETLWIDAEAVQSRIDSLSQSEQAILEERMHRFMGAYGKRRAMPAGTERTRFVLSRLNACPAYYVWLNPEKKIEGLELQDPAVDKEFR